MTEVLSQPGLDRLRTAIRARVEAGQLPGAVMLLARGDAVHVDCIGHTDFERSQPMRRETPFRIASMTKPVIGVATLLLMQDGLLRLDDPVERWLPELANRRVLRRIDGPVEETVPAERPINVEDLLTFRFGFGQLVEPSFDPPFPIVQRANELQLELGAPEPRTPHSPDEWMRLFGTLPLMYQPGQRWQYNVGSLVLGVLIARASGTDLGDFLQQRIFEPLGMASTGFWLPLAITSQLPPHFMSAGDRRDVSSPEQWARPPVFPSGAGGLLSTVDDFLAFARMLLRGGSPVLSEGSVRQMTSNHLTPEQSATGDPILAGRGWGYGVAIATQPSDAWPVPGRYGWMGGYGTVWFNDPHHQVVALLMTQVSDVIWTGLLQEFDQLVGEATRQ